MALGPDARCGTGPVRAGRQRVRPHGLGLSWSATLRDLPRASGAIGPASDNSGGVPLTDVPEVPMIPSVDVLREFRRAPRGVSALLVVAMLLFAQTCAQHGGLACAGGFAGEDRCHSDATLDHDGCAAPADHDGCGGGREDCSGGSICCSTWAPAPATTTLQSPPVIPVAYVVTGSLFQPGAAFAAAPAPIPRGSPPHLVSILRL